MPPIKEVILSDKVFEVLGAAFGKGGLARGAGNAPEAIRAAGLLARLRKLGLEVLEGEDVALPDTSTSDFDSDPKLRNLVQVSEFCNQFSTRVLRSFRAGYTPIILGGDHSTSIASVSAAAVHLKEEGGDVGAPGLLWIDAHGDINTPDTTMTGNIHGMSVAVLLGMGASELTELFGFSPKIRPEHIAYVGLRSIDPGERDFIQNLGIQAFSMKEVDLLGIGEVMNQALKTVSSGSGGFSVSFDMDVCDPFFATAVDTPVRGGLTYREAHLVMELIAESNGLRSLGIMELNPAQDIDGDTCEFAISLIESALGKTIL